MHRVAEIFVNPAAVELPLKGAETVPALSENNLVAQMESLAVVSEDDLAAGAAPEPVNIMYSPGNEYNRINLILPHQCFQHLGFLLPYRIGVKGSEAASVAVSQRLRHQPLRKDKEAIASVAGKFRGYVPAYAFSSSAGKDCVDKCNVHRVYKDV